MRRLQEEGYGNIVFKSHRELDLTRQSEVEAFFLAERPRYVFLGAGLVGGILANTTYPAEFFYSNLAVALNVVHSSYLAGVKKLLFLGSSCIYPREAPMEATVAERGQITLPKAVRDALGLTKGTLLKVELEGSRIVLRKSVDDAISRARGKFALDGFESAEEAVRSLRNEGEA